MNKVKSLICLPVHLSMMAVFSLCLLSCTEPSNIEQQWSVDEVWQRTQSNSSVVLLDVRSEEEYQAGHLPNAINIPISEFEKGIPDVPFAKDTTTVVYCRSGPRANRVQQLLKQAGYSGVYDMRGHFTKWQDMKLPIE